MSRVYHIDQAANASLQNQMNISMVFNYLKKNKKSYRAKISQDLRLSAPAVSRAVETLLSDGVVTETEPMYTEAGKKAPYIHINEKYGFVVSIDIGKEYMPVMCFDFGGNIILEKKNTNAVLSDISCVDKMIEEIKKSQKTNPNIPLIAICIGVPANVDRSINKITESLYAWLEDNNIFSILKNTFNVPVLIENIVNLSAFGEMTRGFGKDANNLVFIEISQGVGAGIVVDRELYKARNGVFGEIGFSIFDKKGLYEKSGRVGYFEKTIAIRDLKEHLLRMKKEVENIENLTSEYICKEAYDGNKEFSDVISEVVDLISIMVINIALMLNPDKIVIGGDICHLPHVQELFINPVMANMAIRLPFDPPKLSLSSLKENVGLVGGACYALETIMREKHPYLFESR